MGYFVHLLIFILVLVEVSATIPTSLDKDVKRYSYICLQSNQNLCLGISPGDGLPSYNESAPPFLMQLKQRLRNEAQALDYKKTRWDVRFQENLVSLSRFSDLCISLQSTDKSLNELALYPCTDVVQGTRLGKWAMDFNNNVNEVSTMELMGLGQCVTVVQCANDGGPYCNPDSEKPVTDGIYRSGTYIKTKPCWWTPTGSPTWKDAQTYVQAIDCAIGCPPMLQFNDVCDPECSNAQCNWDEGMCITKAPTPPTFRPTESPTKRPTKQPTTLQPTHLPTTGSPSEAPTLRPTHEPTSRQPSTSPTKKPTHEPTSKGPTTSPTTSTPSQKPSITPTSSFPSKRPTFSPSTSPTTSTPSFAPTRSPIKVPILQVSPPTEPPELEQPINVAVILAVTIPLLLLLLLCLVLLLVVRERRRRKRKNPKQWNSLIDVNQAAFIEHHRNRPKGVCDSILGCCIKRKSPPSKPPTALSSHLTIDHIVGGNTNWEPAKPGSRRPKLVGS
jgi:hypothetical protein